MYRDILVHLKAHEEWSSHVDAAIAVAKRHNARLTGLLTQSEIALAKQLTSGSDSSGLCAALQAQADARAQRMGERFLKALASAQVDGAFDAAEGRANELLMLAGRFHDLLVIEQTDPAHGESNWESAEEAAVLSGRPTLIIPAKGAFTQPFSRVLVAWNGSREATRALNAALPLIGAADCVVLAQGQGRDHLPSVTKAPHMDIATYLQRYAKAVTVAASHIADAEAGHVLIDLAKAESCDLIVMGAYGRVGLAKWLFGSATQAMFKASPIPILAAH